METPNEGQDLTYLSYMSPRSLAIRFGAGQVYRRGLFRGWLFLGRSRRTGLRSLCFTLEVGCRCLGDLRLLHRTLLDRQQELSVPKLSVLSVRSEKFFVRSLLGNLAIIQDDDPIGLENRGETVSVATMSVSDTGVFLSRQ